MTFSLTAGAQDAAALLGAQVPKQALAAPEGGAGMAPGLDVLNRAAQPVQAPDQGDEKNRLAADSERLAREIRQAKAREKGPRRFAADLFETRQLGVGLTDGGISEDYVLGVGDRLQMNVFGSATFEVPLQVDGRGTIVIPKVGTVSVAGKTLAHARTALQAKVGQLFSRSSVDLSVTKLREVRVFVLGEVYKPGSFLVPNLSSVVNVLGLAGGPTAVGSFRQIRVMRGGRVVHGVDLYPLRAEGLGNLNFGFQNGDTVFVPLLQNQVLLQGGFTRVVAGVQGDPSQLGASEGPKETDELRKVKQEIRTLEARLGQEGLKPAEPTAKSGELPDGVEFDASKLAREEALKARIPAGQVPAAPAGGQDVQKDLERLDTLRARLAVLTANARGDMRLQPSLDPLRREDELAGQPYWLRRWLQQGKAPELQFEMLPGETLKDALSFAGGFALQAFSGSVSIRRINAGGALTVLEAPEGQWATLGLQRGDLITALPQRDSLDRAVKVTGWARVQGPFARVEGQRLGDFLKRASLVLPDTYMERGELVRTLPDGSKQYAAFNLTRAMAGDPAHDMLLQDRDAIELYRVGDLRLPRTLEVVGPVTRPGAFEYMEGMRASDLLFRAGLPLDQADHFQAELARRVDGQGRSEVIRLDLGRLLSSETGSPVDLKDDALNPRLMPFDKLSVFSRPDYRVQRSVILSGQVVRPGVYTLEGPNTTLRELIARAGGLTAEAMPSAGIFLRSLSQVNPERKRASVLAGLEVADDPTANGINDVLGRLNETKRNPTTGGLQPNALLHKLNADNLNRLVVNMPGLLAGDPAAEVELLDGDEIIIPKKTKVAYVVGETASPFASFKVSDGMKVRELLKLAGGPTRNADTSNIRLMKADGRIVDNWVYGKAVEPGDALLVPQRIRRDTTWQENLNALTPLAILINAFKK